MDEQTTQTPVPAAEDPKLAVLQECRGYLKSIKGWLTFIGILAIIGVIASCLTACFG